MGEVSYPFAIPVLGFPLAFVLPVQIVWNNSLIPDTGLTGLQNS